MESIVNNGFHVEKTRSGFDVYMFVYWRIMTNVDYYRIKNIITTIPITQYSLVEFYKDCYDEIYIMRQPNVGGKIKKALKYSVKRLRRY